ncbi:membrane protein insertase YidC [Marinobacter vulgaris]|uniref:Membrane protein insertase YidC n=1 Tax=Marinobacter vulgaris TaxID=1928331 RepID=A0A2V3ZMR2_9GAMM|nr:membrane protein insertase YidC [Marinobacter vulgaris]PXX92665.1 membrane protein insertase YidC [Marinobacter vulgaris]TSJ71390.1 membrane protein insertase YidC [Marinobacter vulgaris]
MDIQRVVLFAGLAIVSYMMVLAWNEDYNQPQTEQVAEQTTRSAASSGDSDNMTLPEDSQGNSQSASEEFTTPEGESQAIGSTQNRSADVSDQLITVRTDVYELKIDRVGGNLIESALLKYDRSLDSKASLRILTNTNRRTYIMESGLIGRDGIDSKRNGSAPVYNTSATEYELEESEDSLTVNLTYTTDNDVEITKQYQFGRDSYEIDVRYLINNQSDEVWQANMTGKIVRDEAPDPTAQNSLGIRAFLGMVVSTPEDPYEKYDFDDLKEDPVNQSVTNGWLAFLQHYFLSAWIPERGQSAQFQSTQRGPLHVMGFVYPATQVAPGETAEVSARAYVGPKIIERLEGVAPNLDRTVDFGFLFFIALPLFLILDWFYGLVGNWGVAIILLTVLVKAVFFKLSATSYRSMARMRAVAPQLTRLKELYGDDRQRMSQEMMALYKREKINPLGGCLPILVQMPVFISLYWVLFESVQLRHAPFMLWIHDLSVMDPYFILPILMGASMMLQMSLNPTPPDPMQAKIMKLMPLVFTVFFLWFPAGLVLYWLVNNILSISQQWYITRKIEAEMANKKS